MNLPELWFVLVGFMLATYVVLDGFDFGVGILHLFIAKNDPERRALLKTIGPVWDGNEVWLIAGGGTLYFAFPALFARGFSGFYLPLMITLWLLTFRALGIEMRHHLDHPLWNQLWDAAFSGSSLLLAVFFGAALGNVVRGVTIGPDGNFFAPLWTDLSAADPVGIIDWYTLVVGVTAAVALTHHGGLWLRWRTAGVLRKRVVALSQQLHLATVAVTLLVSAATLVVQPRLLANLQATPILGTVPLIGVGALALQGYWLRRAAAGDDRRVFLASCAFLYAMMGAAVAGVFPYVLPARSGNGGLLLSDAATSTYGLTVGLYWWLPGISLAIGYFVFLFGKLPKNVKPVAEPEH